MAKKLVDATPSRFAGAPAMRLSVGRQSLYVPVEQLRELADLLHDYADEVDG